MKLNIGDLVKLKIACLGNKIGTLGVVFNEYPAFEGDGMGVQIIFKNGDYDGFSPEEQSEFFEIVSIDNYPYDSYEFNNVMHVSRDFSNGYWNKILNL